MAMGQVVCQKHDANGNLIDRFKKTLLDTSFYEVKFHGGAMTELPPNIIEELTYAQCDVNGNKYLLL